MNSYQQPISYLIKERTSYGKQCSNRCNTHTHTHTHTNHNYLNSSQYNKTKLIIHNIETYLMTANLVTNVAAKSPKNTKKQHNVDETRSKNIYSDQINGITITWKDKHQHTDCFLK